MTKIDFQDWIKETHLYLTELSKNIKVSNRVMQNIKLGVHTPTLLNALKIYYGSKKRIDIESLLKENEFEELIDYKCALNGKRRMRSLYECPKRYL